MQNLYGFDELIEKFLEREISVSEFERRYLDMFQDESIPIEEDPLFSLLEWLFFEVDAYTDLPLEQDEVIDDYIDEDQLRQSAAKNLGRNQGFEVEEEDMLELRGYDVLIEDFLKHKITVKEFERQYLDKFATERILGDELYEPLNWLFAEVDCYTDMPIGPDDDPAFNIDESQLRKSAAEVLQKIRALD